MTIFLYIFSCVLCLSPFFGVISGTCRIDNPPYLYMFSTRSVGRVLVISFLAFLSRSSHSLKFNHSLLSAKSLQSYRKLPLSSGPYISSRSVTMSAKSEEELAAIAASTDPAINPNAPTFFDKLISKQIPANIIYEDDLAMAFRDINPQVNYYFLLKSMPGCYCFWYL